MAVTADIPRLYAFLSFQWAQKNRGYNKFINDEQDADE